MKRRLAAILGSALFLVAAPGFVAGVVPWWIGKWQMRPAFFGMLWFRWAGALLTATGAIVLLDSFTRFAVQGLGTPAPVFPTRRLVVTGLYRYVRNPMYLAVVSCIIGQGLLFGSTAILEYGVAVAVLFHFFVLLYEEPVLRASYDSEYKAYCAAVRRWIPRFNPWTSKK